MSISAVSSRWFATRKAPHRIIIAQGQNVRSFTIRPWLVATVAGVAMAFTTLYLGATGYLVFRDDLLAASIARQARMQHAYEDRIASLRSDIDRLTSRQLLNQESVEAEVERLLGRQAALDARQDVIAGLSQAARRAGLMAKPDEAAPSEPAEASAPPARDPLKTSSIEPSRAGAISFAFASNLEPLRNTVAPLPFAEMNSVEASIDTLAGEQVAYVDSIASTVANRTDRIAAVLKRLGHRVPPSHTATSDVGGPFVEIDPNADPDTFRSSVDLITGEIERFASVRRIAGQLPFAQPVPGGTITSRYGARMDPFLGRPAMHTGIDFRATTGDPARATAGGTIITAEYSGGYGNMVEIDHGNGVTTRFGHLSRIDVKVGQVIAKGAVVGLAGSTGRSTGPHIHYEVRIDGSAIDPMVYVRAGKEIAPYL